MANTLSVMTNVLRNVVSKQRIRYKEKGFNLDLAYVCDNIIAMGYPAEKYESMYRNRLEDVYKFLEENHRDHYKIYNLCLERSYDINKFHGRVSLYPFEDHNPPTIELIQKFCEDVDSWLKADVHNVAAVHCKAGKGRTGTMICCYLLYSGQQQTAEDALSCYDEKRTKDRKGVTIPSQRRYVQYFAKLTRLGLPYNRRTLQFCEIRFLEVNALHGLGTVNCSISVLEDKVKPLQNFTIDFRKNCVLDVKLNVTGDIKVELTKNTKKLFHFWFNTFFVSDSAVEGEGSEEKFIYTLHKREIDDAHKDKEHKSFSEDFKVELVFYTDGIEFGRDNMKVSSGNMLSNHRPTLQCAATNPRLPATQSNNYSLPQNNSSGSEMNYICDQKSSSSTSVSSSLGGTTTDNSNGYESNSKRSTIQHRSGVQNFSNTHHSHSYVAMHDDNIALFTSTPPPPLPLAGAAATTPPGFVMTEKDNLQSNHKHHNKSKSHYLQQTNVALVAATSTPNQRHVQRQSACSSGGRSGGGTNSGGGICGTLGGSSHGPGMDTTSQATINLNSTNSNTSCNHSTNSSKTNSVSSQSSSAIGDNEEDWESGESSAKQIDHITFLVSTSSITTSPAPIQLLPHNNTNLALKDSLRSKQNTNMGNQPLSPCSFPSSSSATCTSNCTSILSELSPSQIASQCPNNHKCNKNSSICTNRVAGGDDDDYVEKVSENKNKFKLPNSNIVAMGDITPRMVESNKGNNIDSNKKALAHTSTAATNTRPKLMHLLMAPKQNTTPQQSHKPMFKRKPSNKIAKSSTEAESTTKQFESVALDTVAGSFGGGVATTSKQKLKIKLKKNKLKFSQKFQWFQSYFRSDPVDFCENFVQQTTSMRRNSICSMASRTHKLSTTTPPSATPPPPPILAGCIKDGSSSCEHLDDRAGAVSVSESTSNASIATGDLCEDYYSYICDNQLSFNNSPCKSPRSMADILSCSISGSGGIGGSYGSSFARSAGSFQHQYLRERRDTLPGAMSSLGARRNNVIVAKPARINAIGFNINTNNTNIDSQNQLSRHSSSAGIIEVDVSPPSAYNTASCSISSDDNGDAPKKRTPFEFPQKQLPDPGYDETNIPTPKPQAKYSLNLVIVQEGSLESCIVNTNSAADDNIISITKSHKQACDDCESDICCDHDKNQTSCHLVRHSSGEEEVTTTMDDMLETKTATCASICSNSSSSGFCTSECCTTNSSSSSCNCNPFAAIMERHTVLAVNNINQHQRQQESKQNTLHEVVEENNVESPTIPAINLRDEDPLSITIRSEQNGTNQ
ncbi:phosphatase and tensin-like protein isoform X2 [Haematobia irritans]|uniref:phosphatase and tensin-like protein isoform X2 n=1 Tax=Haematobia irritans TaxID=7368 RepID=UPI003F4F8B0F